MQCGTDELAEESWEIRTRIMESNYLKNSCLSAHLQSILMPTFHYLFLSITVALRVVRRCSHMGHAADADKFFEITGDKLRPIV